MSRIANALIACSLAIGCRSHFDTHDATAGDAPVAQPRLTSHGQGGCLHDNDTDSVRCWGRGDLGQIGDGLLRPGGTEPAVIGTHARVFMGERTDCALDDAGIATCWGDDAAFSLGDGIVHTPSYSAAPVTVATSHRYVELALGEFHVCGVTTDGGVDCWGDGRCGRLGIGSTGIQMAPVALAADHVAHIGVDDNGGCAIHTDGTMSCWGSIVADGVCHDELSVPVPIAFPGHLAVQVQGGCHETMCVRLDDGTVACWGTNFNGSLGTGTSASQAMPTKVDGIPPALEIAVGATHGCARTTDGVWCWGDNGLGELGLDDLAFTRTYSPVRVPWFDSMPPPDELQAGCSTSCVLIENAVYCWGENAFHQVADGSTMLRPVPTRAVSLTP